MPSERSIVSTALSAALGQVWECIEFWTPLTSVIIILWLLYRPDHFYPTVDSAVLATLNLTTDEPPNLQYDLAVNVSFRNSHSRLSIRYLDISATAFCGSGTKLGPADDALPTPFRQGPKNTTVLHPAFRGMVAVDSMVTAWLKKELEAGMVHVNLRLSLTIKYRVMWPFIEIFFYKYDCWLRFPPPGLAAPAIFDAGTRCWVVN